MKKSLHTESQRARKKVIYRIGTNAGSKRVPGRCKHQTPEIKMITYRGKENTQQKEMAGLRPAISF